MLKKSTLQHLRIPFSIFLMPVFCFSLSVSEAYDWGKIALAFVAIHLFLYPASNGYNSYYDKDEGSIGGLEKPPPVDKELWWTSLVFDAIAILIGFFVGVWYALALFIYGLISKAYSHDKIRLKKYPIISWLVVTTFQGGFIFLAVYQGIHGAEFSALLAPKVLYGAVLATLMLMGSYPMTQIYQHVEDAKRGDKTLSRLLGIKGTFAFTGIVFGGAMGGFAWYYLALFDYRYLVALLIALSPVLLYFGMWFWRVLQDEKNADFRSTMRLNMLSSVCFTVFFGVAGYLNFLE